MLRTATWLVHLTIYRQEVRPFTEKQIELITTFAAQAVIAIENARLLNELRQRTDDLTESLEQQTATSEVLKLISSSPGELEPVFQADAGERHPICEAKFGLVLEDGGCYPPVAMLRPRPDGRSRARGRFYWPARMLLDRVRSTPGS